MADQYLQQLDRVTEAAGADLIPISDDPDGDGRLKAITVDDLIATMEAPAYAAAMDEPLPGPDALPADAGQSATYDQLGTFSGWVTPITNLSPITLDTTNGRVGIGTSSPQYPLHISASDSGMVYSEIRNSVVSGAGADIGGVGIRFVGAVSGLTRPCGRIKSNFTQNNYTSSRIVFQTVVNAEAFVDALTLQNGSAVVGDSNAQRKFDVVGTDATGTVGSERLFQIRRNLNPTVSYPQIAEFALGRYEVSTPHPRSRLDLLMTDGPFGAAAEFVMTWQANGRAGLNTTSPAGILHATAKAATDPVLIAQAVSEQSANLLEVRGANGSVLSTIGPTGAFHPPVLADADAPTNAIYFSTDAGKLAYKDASGVVNTLY